MLGRSTQTLIAVVVSMAVSVSVSAAQSAARLSIASMRGDTARVSTLLAEGVAVNAPQGDGTTALHWAAYRDDVDMARALIAAGADIDARTRLVGYTPLFMASENGNREMIGLLLDAGSDASATTTTGTTPLMIAAASGSAAAVTALLDGGADIQARDVYQGQTALMFAAAPGRSEVVKVLVSRGADVDATSLVPDRLERPSRGNRPNQNSESPEALALGGMTALQFAVREGQMLTVAALVEAGADVNRVTASDQMTTLTIAILNGQFDIASYLLDNGADPGPASTAGVTALFALVDAQWAARVWYPPPGVDEEETNYLDLMTALLDGGADPNARMGPKLWLRQFHGDWVDPAGATAFWRAAQANDVDAMRLLVSAGADPDIPTLHGSAPIQVAAGFGLEPQISTFIPNARLGAVRYLVEEVAADVNASDDRGYTALHGAALTGESDVIRFLVAAGADVRARSTMRFGRSDGANEEAAQGTGDTVADMANGPRERNLVYPEIVELLERLGSENSDNCRASTCIIKPRPADTDPGPRH